MIHAKQWGTVAKCFLYTRSTEAVVAVLQSTGQQQWATAGQQDSTRATLHGLSGQLCSMTSL